MPNRNMWMGTRGFETWVPACNISPEFSYVGTSNITQYLNGGVGVDRSKSAHREYVMSWNSRKSEELRIITDFAKGVYDTQQGTNLIYWCDPFAMGSNAFPQMISTPSEGAVDGMPMLFNAVPTLELTTANSRRYPARTAVYNMQGVTGKRYYFPIPPGYAAHIGVHGTSTGSAALHAAPVLNGTAGVGTAVAMLPVDTDQRTNRVISRNDNATGVEVYLTGTGTLKLAGLIMQILPLGKTPEPGGFISGQGNGGCEFERIPTEMPHSYKTGLVGMSARVLETGLWL